MKHLACCVLSVGRCLSAMSSQANLTYGYTGNQFSNGSGNVTASVTFDSVIDNNFTGLVDINDIIAWSISSAPFAFNLYGSNSPPLAALVNEDDKQIPRGLPRGDLLGRQSAGLVARTT